MRIDVYIRPGRDDEIVEFDRVALGHRISSKHVSHKFISIEALPEKIRRIAELVKAELKWKGP